MEGLAQCEKLSEFCANRRVLYDRAFAITQKVGTLTKIYDNYQLFGKITRNGCLIFDDLAWALFTIDDMPDTSILIHFTELDLYGIFSDQQYSDFTSNISDSEEIRSDINLYQIVISGKKQKLVFACTDPTHFEKLQTYARDCFQVDVSNSRDQITVDIVTQNESEIFENYNRLYRFIYARGDIQCCDSMKQIPLFMKIKKEYRIYSCNDTIDVRGVEQIVKALRHVPSGINTVNINMGVINNIVGNNNVVGAVRANDKKQTARDWVTDNLPADGESVANYYARYIGANPTGLKINQFGSIVRTVTGSVPVQGTGGVRHW